jgi:large subunit ribosomal protein L15e
LYRYITRTWQDIFARKEGNIRERVVELRKQPAIVRVEKPTRIDKARMLGYKAKKGVVVVRARVARGGMRKKRPRSGRRQKHMGVVKIKAETSLQEAAERRVLNRYPNMRLLGSYLLWRDGRYSWYECILVDPKRTEILSDYNYRRTLALLS